MFWRKKDTNKTKVEQANRPPVEELDRFVEWLLRFGQDFAEYRTVVRGSQSNFVNTYVEAVSKDVAGCPDEASLTAHVSGLCADYTENFKTLVDTAGGVQNLPSHLFNKAFPELVKLRVLIYVRQHKYQAAPTEEMLAAIGPLNEI